MKFKFKSGGVSIFVVAVVAIIISVMLLSFLRLMNRDSQMSTQQDLSQSAYDSAYAGAEDAKRALASLQKICSSDNPSDQVKCRSLSQLLKDQTRQSCRILAEDFGIGNPSEKETIIQARSESRHDSKLDQAYTCVKMSNLSDDFVGEISPSQSKTIPLKSTSAVKKIKIQWFLKKDSGGLAIDLVGKSQDMLNMLPVAGQWPQNRPSIIRAQVISGKISAEKSRQATTFLYPTNDAIVGSQNSDTVVDLSFSKAAFDKNSLVPVRCHKDLSKSSFGGYACSATINLESKLPAGSILRLAAQYKSTNYRVEIFDEFGAPIKFDGVQTVVDSTGRANDRFRRIQARLETGLNVVPVPEFTVETDGDFCKIMTVRDQTKPSTIECS